MAGKTILITGASSGIGAALARAHAQALAKDGVTLLLWGRDEARLQETQAQCRALGAQARIDSFDISDTAGFAARLAAADAAMTAEALAAAMGEEKFDLVLTGLQSDDQGHAQMGVILAERLGIPHSTIIMEVQVEESRLRVKRELEGGWFQWIAMPLPALLTIQSGINQLRYATLKGIMAAKKKEIKKVPLPGGLKPAQEILSLSSPVRSKQTQMIGGTPADAARELVRRLREEARVL